MNIICKLFGHDWNTTDKYDQPCKRNRCLASRWLVVDKIKQAYGEKCVEWQVFDLDDLK